MPRNNRRELFTLLRDHVALHENRALSLSEVKEHWQRVAGEVQSRWANESEDHQIWRVERAIWFNYST